MSLRSAATRFCRSRPFKSGSETSSTRQLGTSGFGRERNARADAKVSGFQPAERRSNSSDSRTDTSSSTTKTIGVAGEFGAGLDAPPRELGELMAITPYTNSV
jgi:hypothetical protein